MTIYKLNRPWRVSELQPGVILDAIGFPVCSVSVLPIQINDLNNVADLIVRLVNATASVQGYRIDVGNLNTVHQEIIRERVYQDLTFGSVEEHPHEIPSWIYIMGNAMDNANRFWINGKNDLAIKEMIQATAVGFACLQQYGIPEGAKREIVSEETKKE